MSFENLDNSLTIASRIFQAKAYILDFFFIPNLSLKHKLKSYIITSHSRKGNIPYYDCSLLQSN